MNETFNCRNCTYKDNKYYEDPCWCCCFSPIPDGDEYMIRDDVKNCWSIEEDIKEPSDKTCEVLYLEQQLHKAIEKSKYEKERYYETYNKYKALESLIIKLIGDQYKGGDS